MAKKGKKGIAQKGIDNRKVAYMAVEVWVDVLGFDKRIQLVRTVSLTNYLIHQICWPRLHGNKVMAREVDHISIYQRLYPQISKKILMLNGGEEVPFPTCPLPAYITGFRIIEIHFWDNQVLDFIKLISPRIIANQISLHLTSFHEKQRANVNQLVNMLFKDGFPQTNLVLHCDLAKHGYVPHGGNKMKEINFYVYEESEIPNLLEFLAIPRPDGQQQVVRILPKNELIQKIMDSIKQEFHCSTQSVPQPFYINICSPNLNVPRSEEENVQTNETLTIEPTLNGRLLHICRHPTGQHEKWARDGRNRYQASSQHRTSIFL